MFYSHLHLLLCVEVIFDCVRVDSMFWDIETPQLAVCALMHTMSFRMFTALSYLCFHPWRKSSYVIAAHLGTGASFESRSVIQSLALLFPTFAPVRQRRAGLTAVTMTVSAPREACEDVRREDTAGSAMPNPPSALVTLT